LSFDDASWAITFDGKEFKVSPRAFKIFQFICYGDGIVGSEMIRENVSMCGGTTRIGQILRDNLPDELRLLIAEISGVGGGFYLKLPQKDTAQKDTVQ